MTTRLEVAVGVLIMPMLHPVHVAKQVASIDQYSNGRFLLGLGTGGASRQEIELSGGRWAKRWEYTEECIQVMKGLMDRGRLQLRRGGLHVSVGAPRTSTGATALPAHPARWVQRRGAAAGRSALRWVAAGLCRHPPTDIERDRYNRSRARMRGASQAASLRRRGQPRCRSL